MKAQFLKIAKVKTEAAFYKKFPSQEAFFKAHPEARNLVKKALGGNSTPPNADQFFNYGMQAAGPLVAPETWYQDGGEAGYSQDDEGYADTSYDDITGTSNDTEAYSNIMEDEYPMTPSEEDNESPAYEASEDENTESYNYGGSSNGPLGYFNNGGSKSAWNYGAFPALAKGGNFNNKKSTGATEQGGNINAAGSNIKENFLAYVRKNVANNMMQQPMDQQNSMGVARYGDETNGQQRVGNPYTSMYEDNLNNMNNKSKESNNRLMDVVGEDINYRVNKNITEAKNKDAQDYWNKMNVNSNPASQTTNQAGPQAADGSVLGTTTTPYITPIDSSFDEMNQNNFRNGGGLYRFLPKHQTRGNTGIDPNSDSGYNNSATGKNYTNAEYLAAYGSYPDGTIPATTSTSPPPDNSSYVGPVRYKGDVSKGPPALASTAGMTPRQISDMIAEQNGREPNEFWGQVQGAMGYQSNYMTGPQDDRYKYKHTGYGSTLADPGHIPTAAEITQMQIAGGKNGYDVTSEWKKGIFGRPKKLIITTTYNPHTGKMEQQPQEVLDSTGPAPTWGVPPQPQESPSPLLIPQPTPEQIFNTINYNKDKAKVVDAAQKKQARATMQPYLTPGVTPEDLEAPTQKFGGDALNRFLPKHQTQGETFNAGLDQRQGNPFANAFGKMQEFGSNVNQGYNNAKENIGNLFNHNQSNNNQSNTQPVVGNLNEQAIYKSKRDMNPFTADYIQAGMSGVASTFESNDRRNAEMQLKNSLKGANQFQSVGKNMGDYEGTGQQYGAFRPDQTTATFDTGNMRGNAGTPNYGMAQGGSTAYPYPGQLPFMPGSDNTNDMSMYTHWNQRPVMAQGGAMMEDGIYDLTDEEIQHIIQMGGQVTPA